MKEHEVVAAVKTTTGLDSHEHIEQAVRATLSVLGERLAGGEPEDLARELPPTLAEAIPSPGKGETFGVEEFYQRVAEREGLGCSAQQARQHARVTVASLKAAVSEEEFAAHVAAQLPDEYTDLLSTTPPA